MIAIKIETNVYGVVRAVVSFRDVLLYGPPRIDEEAAAADVEHFLEITSSILERGVWYYAEDDTLFWWPDAQPVITDERDDVVGVRDRATGVLYLGPGDG